MKIGDTVMLTPYGETQFKARVGRTAVVIQESGSCFVIKWKDLTGNDRWPKTTVHDFLQVIPEQENPHPMKDVTLENWKFELSNIVRGTKGMQKRVEIIQSFVGLLLRLQKEKDAAIVDEYLENCKKVKENGAMKQFGSASGAMMLSSCEVALHQIQEKILTHEKNES